MPISATLAGGLALALGASIGGNAVLALQLSGRDLAFGRSAAPTVDGAAQQSATVETT